jgi:superfamily II DNA or RNA helicase
MTKDERQDIGVEKLRRAGFNGTLNYTPRFGKTRAAIKCIQAYKEGIGENILILAPSKQVQKQWVEEIDRFRLANTFCMTIDAAYNKYYKVNETKPDLLIVDELQKYTSDKRFKLIVNEAGIIAKNRTALTGTYPSKDDKISKIMQWFPIVDSISEEEAISNGWISDYTEYNIGMELSDYDVDRYVKFSALISETIKLFRGTKELFKYQGRYLVNSEYQVIMACRTGLKLSGEVINSRKGAYMPAHKVREMVAASKGWRPGLDLSNKYNQDRETYWNPDSIEERAIAFDDYVARRLAMINEHKNKLELVLKLVEKFKDKKIIIFNKSIAFADKLTEAINEKYGVIAACYHSRITSRPLIDPATKEYYTYSTGKKKGQIKTFGKKSLKDYAIDGIKQGYFNILVTVSALNEGFNEESMEISISTAGTANPIEYKQQSARVKTIDPNREKQVKIFNLYFENIHISKPDGSVQSIRCIDKSKLKSRQSDSPSDIVWLKEQNIEEI